MHRKLNGSIQTEHRAGKRGYGTTAVFLLVIQRGRRTHADALNDHRLQQRRAPFINLSWALDFAADEVMIRVPKDLLDARPM